MTTVRVWTRERETLDRKMQGVVVNQGSHEGETENDEAWLFRGLMTTTKRTGQLVDSLSLEDVHQMTSRVKLARESLVLKLGLTMGLLSVAGWKNLEKSNNRDVMTLTGRKSSQRRRLSELSIRIFSLKTRGSKNQNHQMGDQ